MSTVGERIKSLRQQNNMTQADVAKRLGIGKQAVYKYETGAVTNIPLDNIVAMAAMFGTTPGFLAGWSESGVSPGESSCSSVSAKYVLSDANEITLVNAYRAADDRARQDALNTLLSHPAKPKEKTEAG